jgi:uncharacterized protein YggT (Ycf19 family)
MEKRQINNIINLSFLTNLIFGFIEAILGLRIILKFFGANVKNPFTNWIYETSNPLLYPFKNVFPNPNIKGAFVVEFTTLFVLLLFAFIYFWINEYICKLKTKTPVIKKK